MGATHNVDYEGVDETVKFRATDFARTDTGGGEYRYVATRSGTVTVKDDLIVEDQESFQLLLSTTPTSHSFTVGTNDEATIAWSDGESFRVSDWESGTIRAYAKKVRRVTEIQFPSPSLHRSAVGENTGAEPQRRVSEEANRPDAAEARQRGERSRETAP